MIFHIVFPWCPELILNSRNMKKKKKEFQVKKFKVMEFTSKIKLSYFLLSITYDYKFKDPILIFHNWVLNKTIEGVMRKSDLCNILLLESVAIIEEGRGEEKKWIKHASSSSPKQIMHSTNTLKHKCVFLKCIVNDHNVFTILVSLCTNFNPH